MNSMQAALYARVSSAQQTEAHTVASQVVALRERIAADGLPLPEALQFIDEAIAGPPSCDPRWSGCAMWRPLARWTGSMSTRRIGWRANMCTKSCW